MLDVITDFWKPASRKAQAEERSMALDDLQIGATVGFGFVPQVTISGKRLTVTAVNTYRFDEEKLASFVLVTDRDVQVSLIIAEAEGEKYLALSRRITPGERMKLFDPAEFDAVLGKIDAKELRVKDGGDPLKGWLVPQYTKQIHAFSGQIAAGDFRKQDMKDARKFDYYLLVSPNNEHAMEIEKYADGRIEIFATVYRRLTDIGQVSLPEDAEKVVALESRKPEAPKVEERKPEPVKAEAPKAEAPKVEERKPEPQFFSVTPVQEAPRSEPKFVAAEAPKPAAPAPQNSQPAAAARDTAPAPAAANNVTKQPEQPKTETPMNLSSNDTVTKLEPVNGSKNSDFKAANEPFGRAQRNNGNENDSIECELRVANKIIEEAIRGEMRLSDVVRRVVELPVANQESVQLPITLTDEDFMLLSIRYGIPASDRQSIRRRIVEDLNDFTGGKKKTA